jgi:CBS domain-containing protein
VRIVESAPPGVQRPVLWTRGQGCRELAELLSAVEPIRVVGDLVETCVRHRAELLVGRRISSSFDLVSTAVPVDFNPGEAEVVVAAVAGGPHSELATRTAYRLAQRLGVVALIASAYRSEEDKGRAMAVIEALYNPLPGLEYRLVQASEADELVEGLPPRSVFVIGAPGGGWLQRTYFGPGAKLRQSAPSGAVIVKRQPDRVFQVMDDPVFVGPLREAVDILRIHSEPVLAVVDRAQLLGVVRREALEIADPGVPVQALMEEAVSVVLTAPVTAADHLRDRFSGSAIPVVDENGLLVGGLAVPRM